MIQPMATSAIPETDRERDNPNGFTEVERPLLVQLMAMGWDFIQGDLDYPGKTGRAPRSVASTKMSTGENGWTS
jgi:hypothetical protein